MFLFWCFLLSAFFLCHHHVDAVGPVKGTELIYVQNRQKAILKWDFDFSLNEVGFLTIKYWKKHVGKYSQAIVVYSGSNLQTPQNEPQFVGRVSAHLLTGNKALTMEINSISILDQGEYNCDVFLNSALSYNNITKVVVKVPPTLDKSVSSIQKLERNSVSLPCIATAGNPTPLNFQWFKLEKDQFKPVTSAMLDAKRYDYNISLVGRDHRSDYKCKVWNIGGNDEYTITLKVFYAPVITLPPSNAIVFERQGTEQFNCDADANPPEKKFHWYKGVFSADNEIKQNDQYITIENDGAGLKFTKPPRSLATIYYCSASNIHGNGNAKGAYLNITYVPGKITIEDAKSGIFNGNERTNVTVKCVTDANPPAYYTWFKKVKDWKGDTDFQFIANSGSYTGKLTLIDANLNDTGEYKCLAKNKAGEKEHAVNEIVNIVIRYGPRKTNFSVNGLNLTRIEVKQGDPVKIVCDSESEPSARYNIRKESGTPTQLNTNDYVGVYEIASMSLSNEGVYECIASNDILGNEEKRQINLIVAIAPVKVGSPLPPSNVDEYATITYECNAEGKPAPRVYWQKYGANITNDSVIQSSYEQKLETDKKTTTIAAKLTFNRIRYTDDGSYSCIVYNSAGSYNNTEKIGVEFKPKITKRPQNVTVRYEDGKSAILRCEAIGNPIEVNWQWHFEGKRMSEITNEFRRPIPAKEDNGRYTCESFNSKGTGENATAYIIVEYKPTITSITEDQFVDISDAVKLECAADGVPNPVISWTHDRSSVEYIGRTYYVRNIQPKDKGTYSCSAKNLVSSDTKTVRISVRHTPIITTVDPGQVKVGADVGTVANLKCDATAYPTPNITWKESGSTTHLTDGIDGYQVTTRSEDFGTTSTLSVTVKDKHVGKKYVCVAMNTLGDANQEFQILSRGKPDAPVKMNITDIRQPTIPVTVNITIEWTPGYDGGYPVEFILLYREESEVDFKENYIGSPVGNRYVFSNRKAGTLYEFSMKAKNSRGISGIISPFIKYTTKDPPAEAVTVSIARRDDGTSVVITWIIISQPEARKRRAATSTWDYGKIRYKKEIEVEWTEQKILNIARNGSYVIYNLIGDELYEFQFIIYDNKGNFGNPVQLQKIYPRSGPTYSDDSGLSKTDIIALAVGLGGAMLLVIIIILFIALHRKKDNKAAKYKSHYNNGRVQVDIPVSTLKSQYSSDVVRASYLNDEDPFAADTSVIEDDDKSLPPDYNAVHFKAPPPDRDYSDSIYPHSTFRPEDPTPSYTSFGRLPKKQDYPQSKSMTSLNTTRATEISRRNENRYSMDALDDFPERNDNDPLLRKAQDIRPENNRRNQRNSRGRLPPDDDLPEPPSLMRDALRSPPSDEGGINNRVPGAFGDHLKKPSPQPYNEPSVTSPTSYDPNGRLSPAPSSVASSKPYRSDNEYIDDADENYVGYLV